MSVYTVQEIADRVRPVAAEYGIDKVYLFGSYARGEASDDSDIDLYVEFSKPMGLSFCSFFSDIEESVGKNVDIITRDGLYNPASRDSNKQLIGRITAERRCIYEQ